MFYIYLSIILFIRAPDTLTFSFRRFLAHSLSLVLAKTIPPKFFLLCLSVCKIYVIYLKSLIFKTQNRNKMKTNHIFMNLT